MNHWSATVAALAFACAAPAVAQVQTYTADPLRWRPVHYYDLQFPSGEAAHYASIWADKLDANNKAYAAKGDRRFAVGNAPASEAHFSINFENRLVVLSTLDMATGCSKTYPFAIAGANVKLCPLRLASWEGGRLSISEAEGCYLELTATNSSPDPTASVSYVSYDVSKRELRTGMIVSHKVVPQCSFAVPINPMK